MTDSELVEFRFNSAGWLKSIYDTVSKKTATITRDSATQRITSVKDGANHEITFGYTDNYLTVLRVLSAK